LTVISAATVSREYAMAAIPEATASPRSLASGGLRLEMLLNIFLAIECGFAGALGIALGTGGEPREFATVGHAARYPGLAAATVVLFSMATFARRVQLRSHWLQPGLAIKEGALTWLLITISLSAVLTAAGANPPVSNSNPLIFFTLGLIGLILLRWGEQQAIRHFAKTGSLLQSRALLIRQMDCPFSAAAGTIAAAGRAIDKTIVLPGAVADAEFGRRIDDAIAHLRGHTVSEVLLAASWSDAYFIEAVVRRLSVVPISVTLIADPAIGALLRRPLLGFGADKAVELQRPPLDEAQQLMKRLLDLTMAGLLLMLLLPLFALIAAAIAIDSRGPILFRQRRAGFNSQVFHIYKFRSMTVLDDGAVVEQAQRCDTRVTRVGRVLRRFSLDELPQLLNVLRGNMSLVGPRPHALAHDSEYGQLISSYAARHKVKPGITGWAQVNGWRGATPEPYLMARRVEHDLWYIENWSLWLDIKILMLTAFRLYGAENAY
jgi:Undecaprenyl-phosphate glucose phosphotransferase